MLSDYNMKLSDTDIISDMTLSADIMLPAENIMLFDDMVSYQII
jgi:hypothetical protein